MQLTTYAERRGPLFFTATASEELPSPRGTLPTTPCEPLLWASSSAGPLPQTTGPSPQNRPSSMQVQQVVREEEEEEQLLVQVDEELQHQLPRAEPFHSAAL